MPGGLVRSGHLGSDCKIWEEGKKMVRIICKRFWRGIMALKWNKAASVHSSPRKRTKTTQNSRQIKDNKK